MTNNNTFTTETKISRTQDILFDKVGEEVVMLNLDKGRYHALDEIGGEIWELIAEPIQIADLVDCLQSKFDVPAEDCLHDVMAYIADLQERDLLEIHA